MAMAVASSARLAGLRLCLSVHQTLSLVPCTVTVSGHNRGESGGDAASRKDTRQDR